MPKSRKRLRIPTGGTVTGRTLTPIEESVVGRRFHAVRPPRSGRSAPYSVDNPRPVSMEEWDGADDIEREIMVIAEDPDDVPSNARVQIARMVNTDFAALEQRVAGMSLNALERSMALAQAYGASEQTLAAIQDRISVEEELSLHPVKRFTKKKAVKKGGGVNKLLAHRAAKLKQVERPKLTTGTRRIKVRRTNGF